MEKITAFKNLLNTEIIRLECQCEKWQENFLAGSIPEEESGNILSVIGQTKLLIKEKFRQFYSLIEISEKNDPSNQKVTVDDLEGFWDLISIQIENINNKFNILEEKEAKEWKNITDNATDIDMKPNKNNYTSNPETPSTN